MLDLKKDIYSRLVLSAHKNKSLNKPFRNISFDSWRNLTPKEAESSIFDKSADNVTDKTSIDEPVVSESRSSEKIRRIIRPTFTEKIDEKVERIIGDPRIAEITIELEIAEKLLKKIKSIDTHNPKIPLLEQTIYRLRSMLEQKSYV